MSKRLIPFGWDSSVFQKLEKLLSSGPRSRQSAAFRPVRSARSHPALRAGVFFGIPGLSARFTSPISASQLFARLGVSSRADGGAMSRIRWFTLFTACLLVASAAWADDLGFVDCASHPESAQLFSKARQTPDSLGNVPCGERFAILVYGFVFSRVQTRDGKIGYVYSNLIIVDQGGAAPQAAAARVPDSSASSTPSATPVVAGTATTAPAYAQPSSNSLPVTTPLPPPKRRVQATGVFPTPPVPAVTPADMASTHASVSSGAQAAPVASQPAAAVSSAPALAASAQPLSSQPAASASSAQAQRFLRLRLTAPGEIAPSRSRLGNSQQMLPLP